MAQAVVSGRSCTRFVHKDPGTWVSCVARRTHPVVESVFRHPALRGIKEIRWTRREVERLGGFADYAMYADKIDAFDGHAVIGFDGDAPDDDAFALTDAFVLTVPLEHLKRHAAALGMPLLVVFEDGTCFAHVDRRL